MTVAAISRSPNRQGVLSTNILAWGKVGAGWSSPVARQAHNLKVVGSNPTPAPNLPKLISIFSGA